MQKDNLRRIHTTPGIFLFDQVSIRENQQTSNGIQIHILVLVSGTE